MRFALTLVLLLLVALCGVSFAADEGSLSPDQLEQLVQSLDSEAAAAGVQFYFTRHMLGSWNSLWTHACPPAGEALVSSKGAVIVSNISAMSFTFTPAARYLSDFGNRAVTVDLQGEGTRLPYTPFLRSGAIPGSGKRGGRDISLGYQICTMTKNRIPTFTEETKMLGDATETTVLRGFVFEELLDEEGKVLVLDRCVEGLNRNFNFILTTIGEPLAEEETRVPATEPSQLTRKLRFVRAQFRLPGSMKCQTTDGVAMQHADIDAVREVAPTPYDYAADEAWEVLQWTRTDPIYQSFLDRHFAMLVFAVLFIFFRIFTGYRFNSQKLEIQKTILEEVKAKEDASKQEIVDAVNAANKPSNNKRNGPKKGRK